MTKNVASLKNLALDLNEVMKKNDLLRNEILNSKSFQMKFNFYMNIISKDSELQSIVS